MADFCVADQLIGSVGLGAGCISQDTFLLCDSTESHRKEMQRMSPPYIVVEEANQSVDGFLTNWIAQRPPYLENVFPLKPLRPPLSS